MLCIYHELQRTDFILVIILVWYFHVFVGLWPNCLWLTGPVWGWKRHQQRRSRGTAQSVWGEARNQPSVAGGGAGAGAQGGGRRKWCELLSQRMGLHKQKLKKWCELLSENEAQQEEKYMNLCQRTRLSKVKKKKLLCKRRMPIVLVSDWAVSRIMRLDYDFIGPLECFHWPCLSKESSI